MSEKPPEFIQGVLVSPRVAAVLERHLDLRRIAAALRESDDEEAYRAVHAIRWEAAWWTTSRTRTLPAPTRELEAQPREPVVPSELLGSARVAERLGFSPRWVQLLAQRGELEGSLVGRRWLFSSEAVENYRRRAA